MNADEISIGSPLLQTINECLRVPHEASPAHSNDKPDVFSIPNRINVRFVPDSPFQLQIKTSHENNIARE
jgi:hypothetical protein